jgi:hypothetical protein
MSSLRCHALYIRVTLGRDHTPLVSAPTCACLHQRHTRVKSSAGRASQLYTTHVVIPAAGAALGQERLPVSARSARRDKPVRCGIN